MPIKRSVLSGISTFREQRKCHFAFICLSTYDIIITKSKETCMFDYISVEEVEEIKNYV